MSGPEHIDPLAGFLGIMARLPPTPGITWHGLGEDPRPRDVITTRTPVATSRDVRVAGENFTVPFLACLISTTGRYIAAMSAFPADHEVVVLPGTTFLRLAAFVHEGVGVTVFEELDVDVERPAEKIEVADLVETLHAQLTAARSADPVIVNAPGKYTAPIG